MIPRGSGDITVSKRILHIPEHNCPSAINRGRCQPTVIGTEGHSAVTEICPGTIELPGSVPDREPALGISEYECAALIERRKVRVSRTHSCDFFSRTQAQQAGSIWPTDDHEVLFWRSCNLRYVIRPVRNLADLRPILRAPNRQIPGVSSN